MPTMFTIAIQRQYNTQITLSILIIFHLVFSCKAHPSTSYSQSTSSVNTPNPVIHPLTIILNNRTKLRFNSYRVAQDLGGSRPQVAPVSRPKSSDLIYIGPSYFDDNQCLLLSLPTRNTSWFGAIDLRNNCSSLDGISNVLRSANDSFLRGVFLFVDEIPSASKSHSIFNSSGAFL